MEIYIILSTEIEYFYTPEKLHETSKYTDSINISIDIFIQFTYKFIF